MGKNILRCLVGVLSISVSALVLASLAVPPVIFLKIFSGTLSLEAGKIYFIILLIILALCIFGYYYLGKNLIRKKTGLINIIPVIFLALWNLLLLYLTYIFESSNPELSRVNFNLFCLFNAPWMNIIMARAKSFAYKGSIIYSVLPSFFIYLGVRKI